jgi:lysophospholipase L1-like esterase
LADPWRESYPAVLQVMLREKAGEGYEVRNFGCNGASVRADSYAGYVDTSAFRSSLVWEPDIVLLMLGSNDASPYDWDPEAFRRDYEQIVASYQGLPSAPRIILIAPPRIHRVMGETFMGLSPEILEGGIRPAIRAVAAAAGFEFIDLVDLFPDARYCFDGVHPKAAGAQMMAEAIIDSVKW